MQITFKGSPVQTIGELPQVGTKAPDFSLVKTDLSTLSLKDLAGKNVLLNIFISLDTPVCAESVAKFNQKANQLPNTVVLCVSMDLPFAHARFCSSKGLENVTPVSAFRNPEFGRNYGLTIKEGPLAQLLARAVVLINPKGEIAYTELVSEITHEPNYEVLTL